MKSEHAKRLLHPTAVKHYLNQSTSYSFMSLWDDNEPYPLSEVIELQRGKIADIQREISEKTAQSEPPKDPYTKQAHEFYLAQSHTRFLQRELTKAEEILERLEYREKEVARKKKC